MINVVVALVLFLILLILINGGVKLGRYVGNRHLAQNEDHKLEVVSVAEGAVFALLGLLIAFSFSGAYGRFEQRKIHVIEEANAYRSAYEYVDLLGHDKQTEELREDVRQFLDAHIAAYQDIPYFRLVFKDLDRARMLQKKIWQEAIVASEKNSNQNLGLMVVPAMSTMFDEAFSGLALSLVHPPVVIFALLIGLALLGAFLSGYSNAGGKMKRPLHTICYVFLTTVTICIIINMEYPRVGLIRVSNFDYILQGVRDQMLVLPS